MGRPAFRTTNRCSANALPPLGEYGTFLEEHTRFYDATRINHQVITASAAAANRHRNCLEGRVCKAGPEWISSTTVEPAARKASLGRKPAIRRGRVAMKDGRRTCDGSTVTRGTVTPKQEVDGLPPSKKRRTIFAVQDSHDAAGTGEKRKRRSMATGDSSTNDVGSNEEPPKPKTVMQVR